MILPAQFANEVRKGENILFCPYCSRILFYEEATEDETSESYFKLEDTGSLADLDDDEGSLGEESEDDDEKEGSVSEEDSEEDEESEESEDDDSDSSESGEEEDSEN